MYPYDAPATEMSGYWSDGAYTPSNTVAYIRDDVTPINKNAMVNSVGKQLSLIQNFVNSSYLGRSGDAVSHGYITSLHATSLISTSWASAAVPGSISLCSNLYPVVNNSLTMGAITQRFNSMATSSMYAASISGLATGQLRLDSDIIPVSNDALSIGTAAKRIGTIEVSGLHAVSTSTTSLVSPSFVSEIDPGVIYLRSNIAPNITGLMIGAALNRVESLWTEDIKLFTSYTTYASIPGAGVAKARAVWVDGSGYLRRGDFPATV